MGEEAFRSEEDFVQTGIPLNFSYRRPRSTADLIAPNRHRVVILEMAETNKDIELVKGVPTRVELGVLSMMIEPNNLVAGSNFIATPVKLVCTPKLGGASPRVWEYMIEARFDGSCLSAEIPQISVSLQNKNLATPVRGIDNTEEIIMTFPFPRMKLSATLDQPYASAEIMGQFTWLDER